MPHGASCPSAATVMPTTTSHPIFQPTSNPTNVPSSNPTNRPSYNNGCFHADSVVELDNGKLVKMNQIRFGDRIAAFDSQGKKLFSTVYSFATAYPNRTIEAIQLHLDATDIILSSSHMLFASKTEDQAPIGIQASSVTSDMYLWKESNGHGVLKPVKVTSVNKVWRTGFYSPWTESGTLIVNGVAASAYVTCWFSAC